MKKRITAFALCLVMAFGAVTYRQPKANAVLLEGTALATACLSVYLMSTGFSFAPNSDNWDADEVNEAIASNLVSKYDEFCNYMQGDPEETQLMIREGVQVLEDGVIKLSSKVANWYANFEDWLIEKLGLIDENGVPTTVNVSRCVIYTANGKELPFVPATLVPYVETALDDYTMYYLNLNEPFEDYVFSTGYTLCMSDGVTKLLDPQGNRLGSSYNQVTDPKYVFIADVGGNLQVCTIRKDGTWNNVLGYIDFDTIVGSSYSGATYTTSLDPNYEKAPTLDEQYSMVIDTGLSYEDEQSFIDSVLSGMTAGTLQPEYSIEKDGAGAGDVVVPEEDEENPSVLNWVKKIQQSVQALPRTIADAVANVFVPSAEYMATVPETIVNTFDNRTGFLTYPISVLHDFIGRLSAGQQDFVLKWPTVYEPNSKAELLEAGQFNVSKFVRDNDFARDIYTIYQWVVSAYMTYLFLGLCKRKYNSVIGAGG